MLMLPLNEDEVVSKVEDVSLVDGVFDGALEAMEEEEEEKYDEDDERSEEDDYLIKMRWINLQCELKMLWRCETRFLELDHLKGMFGNFFFEENYLQNAKYNYARLERMISRLEDFKLES
ncbi:hypothetical protein Tco_1257254, partial [Tanacetum coccineum]